ncbi:MAG: chaperone modulator CbpM [Gammaproteobacteria bacterium]|nr:chaperone modulator CbpM [Gammaproteobacteria bacterium]NND36468.1 MerR family transcriptional regulator [Gammaproteobacteria bacterium]
MSERDDTTLTGSIFDETTEVTVVELCRICSVDMSLVEEMVLEGVLEPTGGTREDLRFPYHSVRRARTVIHLQRDLGLNLAGAALALELLDRIEYLRSQLRRS